MQLDLFPVVDCGRPPVLPNGRGYLLNGTTTYDSVIEYHCMPDFKVIGEPTRRCLATGAWSNSLPRCLEIALINEMADNGLDTRSDLARSTGTLQMESSKAIGIGIAVGIGALLVLILTIAVVCLKTKKPQPVKNTENVEVNPNRIQKDDTATVMSYSRLSLESEAAAAAANGIQNGIRHHPNGLVTFSSPNGHHHNNQNGHANGNGNGHLHGGYSNGHYQRSMINGSNTAPSTVSVAIRSNHAANNGSVNSTPRFMAAQQNGHRKGAPHTTTLEV